VSYWHKPAKLALEPLFECRKTSQQRACFVRWQAVDDEVEELDPILLCEPLCHSRSIIGTPPDSCGIAPHWLPHICSV
jgi:hypothetical protein